MPAGTRRGYAVTHLVPRVFSTLPGNSSFSYRACRKIVPDLSRRIYLSLALFPVVNPRILFRIETRYALEARNEVLSSRVGKISERDIPSYYSVIAIAKYRLF